MDSVGTEWHIYKQSKHSADTRKNNFYIPSQESAPASVRIINAAQVFRYDRPVTTWRTGTGTIARCNVEPGVSCVSVLDMLWSVELTSNGG